ncbi:MAG: Cna B-type domain-containing protein [Firmicutes bacterium]|nr:Cna B-type domain-containing protein [Bacillota bacterium]
MKKYKSLAAFLLCLVAAISFLPVTALAAGSIDLNHSHSLTVTAVYGQTPISAMQFDAYLISTVDECGELTVVDRYQEYADDLDIRGKDDERWQAIAQILAREITLDNTLKPSRSAVTDADGVAVFSDIPMGLYLILGNTVEKDGYVYSTSPFFAIVPEQDMISNIWNYDVVANAKPGREPVKADYEVIKVWKDDCHKDKRPKSITISLICDGEVYDTITLPHNGAWSYTWKDLETNHQWTVTEKKEDGYQDPDVLQEGNTFIVTNTCNKPTTPPQPGKPTLPQTGQLWWPVPVLIAAGLLFVVIGLLRRRGAANEK